MKWLSKLCVLLVLVSGWARADVTYDYVRIACVPETGLLDVQYRGLHDAVTGRRVGDTAQSRAALEAHGFYRPRGLLFTCKLGDVSYVIKAEQDEPREQGMCSADPAVWLDVSRNGAPMFRKVVFGGNCEQMPALTRLTIGDGLPPESWAPPDSATEAHVCYTSGRDNESETCKWLFGKREFAKTFPLDQHGIARLAGRPEN
jgi:hypothetical protein